MPIIKNMELIEKLDELKSDGYIDDLNIRKGSLYSSENYMLPIKNVRIDKTCRIEDDSDPTHQTVVYALSCEKPDVKGVLINSYGPYSEPDKDMLIDEIAKNKNRGGEH
jgi:hypothetical protein